MEHSYITPHLFQLHLSHSFTTTYDRLFHILHEIVFKYCHHHLIILPLIPAENSPHTFYHPPSLTEYFSLIYNEISPPTVYETFTRFYELFTKFLPTFYETFTKFSTPTQRSPSHHRGGRCQARRSTPKKGARMGKNHQNERKRPSDKVKNT